MIDLVFCRTWLIDEHALRYFGICRFTDMPGYFPQLSRAALASEVRP